MKRILLAALLLTSVSAFAVSHQNNIVYASLKSDGGKQISPAQVPVAVMTTFNAMFPGARNVQWELQREDGGKTYQAEFTFNGKRFKAWFAPDGTFLGKQRT